MSTLLSTDQRLSEYAVTVADDTIAEWSERFMSLAVTDTSDTKAIKTVHDARMIVRNARIEVEKTRKRLKEDSLDWGRKVDAEAKRLTALMKPIEDHLETEENRVAQEKERVRLEREEAIRVAMQKRVDALLEVGDVVAYATVAGLTEAEYLTRLATSTEVHRTKKEAEAERLRLQAVEDAKRKAEQEQLAAERAELDKIKKEQEAEANRIAAEKKKLDDVLVRFSRCEPRWLNQLRSKAITRAY